MKILFIGDIVGQLGRKTVGKILPRLRKKQRFDLVIANAENATHGSGISESALTDLKAAGIDYFTLGDHAFKRLGGFEAARERRLPIIRPANFPPDAPGAGHALINHDGHAVLLINLLGRVFMDKDFDCPFRAVKNILANFTSQNLSAIIVDIHAEATSEKIAMRHFLNGRVAAVLGTHTHVMTNDAQITERGTAYITDVGMVGAADGIIGVDKDNILESFLTQISLPHVLPEKGRAIMNAVQLTIDPKTGRSAAIKPLIIETNIT